MGIPILHAHDNGRPIGYVEMRKDGGLHFRFNESVSITKEQCFEIFGNVGIRVDRMEKLPNGDFRIFEGVIFEFSL